ncbi:hypothetical protein SCORR_v1c04370 [Spiroplasma corruscae]|uniref:Lipoprotein n=1 Tax=Spiroplasma corruscae TaxID=216934 RepID=A0A222EP88_9MOLU|nr:hypothetical protein [Spiroplasma corruscae]ASP28211.1 hypothetical protein SCORR_v1c04370 [Spiroplasma corruscae]
MFKKISFIFIGFIITLIFLLSTFSCAKDSQDNSTNIESDNQFYYSNLLDSYKKDVLLIIKNHHNISSMDWIENEENAKNNSFFTSDNIIYQVEYYKKNNNYQLDDMQKKYFLKDMENKLYIDKLSYELNELKSNSKYDVLLNNINNLYNGVDIDFSSLEISYEKITNTLPGQEQITENFYSNISLKFNYWINYLDKNKKPTKFNTIDYNFNYSLNTNTSLENAWKNLIKNLEFNFLGLPKEISNGFGDLDAKKLKINSDDKTFCMYQSKNINLGCDQTKELNDYFNNKELDQIISKLLQENVNLKESIRANTFKPYNFVEDSIDYNNIFSADKDQVNYSWNDGGEGQKFYNIIFNNIDNEMESENSDILSNYVNKSSLDWKKTFNNGLKNIVDDSIILKDSEKELIKSKYDSYSVLGTLNIDNLEVVVKGDNGNEYSQKLPQFKIQFSYSVDLSDKYLKQESNVNNSATLKSTLINLKQGINIYKNAIGISKKDEKDPLSPILTFTGNAKKVESNDFIEKEFSIWEYLKKSQVKKYDLNFISDFLFFNILSTDFVIRQGYYIKVARQFIFDVKIKSMLNEENFNLNYSNGQLLFPSTNYDYKFNLIFKINFINISFNLSISSAPNQTKYVALLSSY